MGVAVPILGAVGAGISAIGAIGQGEANAATANYQAQVAKNNQIIAQNNANYATAAGNAQTYDVGLEERAKAAKITSGLAASNLDINTGSAANVRKSQAELGQLSEERTEQSAALTRYGYTTAASSYGAEAQLEKAQAPLDVTAGFLGGFGALASGASNVGFKFAGLQNPTPLNYGTALAAAGGT